MDKRRVWILTFLVLLNPNSFLRFCEGEAIPKESINIDDRFISTSIKLMLKSYILTADLKEIKKAHIERLKNMKEESFKEELNRFCNELKGSPLEGIYGISINSTREEVISVIDRLDKKEINKIVNSLPDKLIADRIKNYFSSRHKMYSNKKDFLKNLKEAWEDLIRKLTLPEKILP